MSYDSDESVATELDLYAENTSELYGQFKSIIANLAKKIKSGKYDASKAPKLWMYWYNAAAQRYCKENQCEVKHTFPKKVREIAAKARAHEEHTKLLNGEYGSIEEACKFAHR
jgi:hypothetical protein